VADPFLDLTDFSLVWGPLELPEPAYSFADDWESQFYTPDEIADAILCVPGVRLKHAATPGWERWAAAWAEGPRYIEFDMMACDFDPDNDVRPGISVAWGGSNFEMHCLLSDVLRVWRGIQQRCPAVWLHNSDCRMYSPELFEKEYGA
jgi:hypothetical protein